MTTATATLPLARPNTTASSLKYLTLVPALSTVVYVIHIREHYQDQILLGLLNVVAFGCFYIAWTWVLNLAVYAARASWAGRQLRVGKIDVPVYALQSVVSAITGLYVAQELTTTLFTRVGWTFRLVAPTPFFATNATIFLIVAAFRSYRERLQALRNATLEAQYSTLKNQLRPHFLFNSLNSLSELIEIDRELAIAITQKLSDLYRQILRNSSARTSPLRSELDIIQKYLEIEQLRFEERVHFQVRVPEAIDDVFVPSLMLQTLVENAVKHGIAPSLTGGSIDLAIDQPAMEWYRLTLTNTGAPYTKPAGMGTGTGLRNTRERLSLLYGSHSRFQISRTAKDETTVSFYFSGACLNDD